MTQIQRQSGDAVIDTEKFTKFPNWNFQTRLSPNTRSVYVTLLSFGWRCTSRMAAWRNKRVVWPSVQVIAEMANVSLRTARNCVRELEKAGLISTEPQFSGQTKRASNRYVLHRDFGPADPAPEVGKCCRYPGKCCRYPGTICRPPRQDLPQK